MPLIELTPTLGSLASGIIAIFAAGLVTRGGALVVAYFALLLAVPVAVRQFGFDARADRGSSLGASKTVVTPAS